MTVMALSDSKANFQWQAKSSLPASRSCGAGLNMLLSSPTSNSTSYLPSALEVKAKKSISSNTLSLQSGSSSAPIKSILKKKSSYNDLETADALSKTNRNNSAPSLLPLKTRRRKDRVARRFHARSNTADQSLPAGALGLDIRRVSTVGPTETTPNTLEETTRRSAMRKSVSFNNEFNRWNSDSSGKSLDELPKLPARMGSSGEEQKNAVFRARDKRGRLNKSDPLLDAKAISSSLPNNSHIKNNLQWGTPAGASSCFSAESRNESNSRFSTEEKECDAKLRKPRRRMSNEVDNHPVLVDKVQCVPTSTIARSNNRRPKKDNPFMTSVETFMMEAATKGAASLVANTHA